MLVSVTPNWETPVDSSEFELAERKIDTAIINAPKVADPNLVPAPVLYQPKYTIREEIKINMKRFEFVLIMLILCLNCHRTPTQVDQIELREDFSESEFKEAIIGKWESVFEIPGKQNIGYLELTRQGNAKIIIKQDGNKKEHKGSYSLTFLRPPMEGNVTLAELTIITSKESIILSRVNFGIHNAFPAEVFFLRIDKEPYGVLQRMI